MNECFLVKQCRIETVSKVVFHENPSNAVIERGGDGKETPMYYIRSLYLDKRTWKRVINREKFRFLFQI